MRINIYQEEILGGVDTESKVAENTGKEYFAVAFPLLTPDVMVPPKHEDDDTSAVKFWVNPEDDIAMLTLARMFYRAGTLVLDTYYFTEKEKRDRPKSLHAKEL